MLDHGQGLAGVAVDDHGHVAVPFAHRGLIDQKHPAPAAAAVLGQRRGPGLDQTVDEVPAEAVAPCRSPQRHDPRVRDEPPGQTPRQLVLELGMILEMARRAVVAHEPAPVPHQRRPTPRHLQIAHLAPARVVHPGAAEPARRAPRPPHGRLDLHPQLTRRVLDHLQHADLAQVQPHPHNIGSHRGPPGSLICQSPIPAGPRPLLRDPQPPRSPRFRAGSTLLESRHLGDVLASKKEQQRVRRSLGVRGREAWSAYETLTSGLPILDDSLSGVNIWFRELPSGDRTVVCFFREGMWITSQAKHLQKADFDDRVPFCAVVNVEHLADENGESVCSLVREAEGETHSQIRPTEITDIGMRRRLEEALERIGEILRNHAPERRAENIEPEQLRFFHGKTLTVVPRPPRTVVLSDEHVEDVIEVVTGGNDGGGRGSGDRGRGGGEDDGRRRSPKRAIAHGNTSGIRTASRHLRDRCWAVAWASNRFHFGGAVVRVVVPSGADETTDRYVSDEYLPISALRMNGQTLVPHDADRLEVLLTNPPTIGEAEIELATEPHEQDIAVLRIQVMHRHQSVRKAPA